MVSSYQRYYQAWHGYLSAKMAMVDPEKDVIKSAFRTALACVVCMLLFHYLHADNRVSILAGFAAFSFVQNDPHGLAWPRLCFLSAIIIVFTGITFMGLCLSVHRWAFWLSIPLLTFIGAYLSCLGTTYFNAGVWALILYVFAGGNPMSVSQALPVVWVFLCCGVICLVICFGVFPIRAYQRLLRNYRSIFKNLMAVLRSDQSDKQHLSKAFNNKIDHLLILHQQNLYHYFKACGTSLAQQNDFREMAKLLYQVGLMLKSMVAFRKRIVQHADYSDTQLDIFHHEIMQLLAALMQQSKTAHLPDFTNADRVLDQCRERLTIMRQELLHKAALLHTVVNFTALFDYSNYFYHIIQLYALLKNASNNIAVIQHKRLSL